MTVEKMFKTRVRDRMARTGESYTTAYQVLNREADPPGPAAPTGSESALERHCRFREASIAAWRSLAKELGGDSESVRWPSAEGILRVLRLVAERAPLNHAHFPDGGGLDLVGASEGSEPGCITLARQGECPVVIRPKELLLVQPEDDPLGEWIYFRLETGVLAPFAVDEESSPPVRPDKELLVEIAPGCYVDRACWSTGFYQDSKHADSLPLPDGARLLYRFLRGPFLLVAKGSIYNLTPGLYDGQHATMSAEQFHEVLRDVIRTAHQNGWYGRDPRTGVTLTSS